MASRLFHELCGGAVAPGTVDVWGERPPAPPRLRYRPATPTGCSACRSTPLEQADILRRLECEVEPATAECRSPKPTSPSRRRRFRRDLERPVDLVEEVGRIHGLENLPETLPLRRDAVGVLTGEQQVRRRIADTLAGAGLDEVVAYSFVAAERARAAGARATGDRRAAPVALANPMSAEQAVMRTTLLPGLLAAVAANLAQQAERVAVFEQGRVYLPQGRRRPAGAGARSPRTPASRGRSTSPRCWASRSAGRRRGESWTGAPRPTDFFTIKGYVERLLAASASAAPPSSARASRSCTPARPATLLLGGERAGSLGLLRPDVAARFGVEDRAVYVAELAVAPLAGRALAISAVRGSPHLPAGQPGPRRRRRRRRAGGAGARPRAPGRRQAAARGVASSTSTKATRCRPASARWPCGSSCARPSAR